MAAIKTDWYLSGCCDKCGPNVTPKVVFILASGGMLMLCNHCRKVNEKAIQEYLGDEPNTIHAPPLNK